MKGKKRGTALTAVLTTVALVFTPAKAMGQELYAEGDQPFYMKQDGLYQYYLDGSGLAKLADVTNSETDYYLLKLAWQSLDGRYTLYFKTYDYYGDSGILCYRDSENPETEQVIGENISEAFFFRQYQNHLYRL